MGKEKNKINNVVLIADFLPRKCGIATFTHDLRNSMAQIGLSGKVDVVAMDDQPEGYDYPDCVKFQVNDRERDDYVRAAEFINMNGYELAIVQHEFGIFGGKAEIMNIFCHENTKTPLYHSGTFNGYETVM